MASTMAQEESTYQRLLDEGYSEEQIAMILGLAGLGQQEGRYSDMLEYAKALRKGKTPEGRQAGNVYVAANPLEHLADVGNVYVGNKNYGVIQDAQRRLAEEQMRRRMEYLRAAPKGTPSVTPPRTEFGL